MTPRSKRRYVARGHGRDELIRSAVAERHRGGERRWGWRGVGVFVLASAGWLIVGHNAALLGEAVFWIGWIIGSGIWWVTFLAMARPWERRS